MDRVYIYSDDYDPKGRRVYIRLLRHKTFISSFSRKRIQDLPTCESKSVLYLRHSTVFDRVSAQKFILHYTAGAKWDMVDLASAERYDVVASVIQA